MIEKLRFDKLVTYDSAQPSTQVPKPVIEYVERVVEVPLDAGYWVANRVMLPELCLS